MSSSTDRSRTQAPKPHPDWFWSLSGGIDSTAAFLLTKDALETSRAGGNYSKKPVAVYLDTRIGLPLNRLYVEELCDRYHVQLWTLRTDEHFESWVRDNDAPGGGAHGRIRDRVKGRQSSKLTTLADYPVMVLGLAADESDDRAALSKAVEKRRHVEVYPAHRLSRIERAKVILRREDCPINPLWLWPAVIDDCGCLANGDPSELDRTAERFPWFAQRLREYEESIDADGLRSTLGWDGLTATEKGAVEAGHEQMTLCSDGCGRRRDPAVVRAFRARVHGATPDESIAILDGGDTTTEAVIGDV